jgi:hypothetical protein
MATGSASVPILHSGEMSFDDEKEQEQAQEEEVLFS